VELLVAMLLVAMLLEVAETDCGVRMEFAVGVMSWVFSGGRGWGLGWRGRRRGCGKSACRWKKPCVAVAGGSDMVR
jgi:hypothetical protein